MILLPTSITLRPGHSSSTLFYFFLDLFLFLFSSASLYKTRSRIRTYTPLLYKLVSCLFKSIFRCLIYRTSQDILLMKLGPVLQSLAEKFTPSNLRLTQLHLCQDRKDRSEQNSRRIRKSDRPYFKLSFLLPTF